MEEGEVGGWGYGVRSLPDEERVDGLREGVGL